MARPSSGRTAKPDLAMPGKDPVARHSTWVERQERSTTQHREIPQTDALRDGFAVSDAGATDLSELPEGLTDRAY